MIAVCCGKGMDYPVVLSLSANILGLTVEYNVLSTDHQNRYVHCARACIDIPLISSTLVLHVQYMYLQFSTCTV